MEQAEKRKYLIAKVLVFPLVIILTLAGLAVRVFIRLGSVVLGVSALVRGFGEVKLVICAKFISFI